MKIELGRADKDRKISMDVDVMLTTRLLRVAKMIQDTPDRRLVAAEWMFID